jgi:multiple sugar transport system substrate-binding protein
MLRFVLIGLLVAVVGMAGAQQVVEVLAQPRVEWEMMERLIPEFEEQTGITVNITYFAELERRSRSRLDASSGAGQFHVYYIDEANIVEFASNGWVVPILDYFPEEYDFSGFSPGLVDMLSFEGTPYAAPITKEGDIMFYRRDLLEAQGLSAPTTLDEYLEVVQALHDPPRLYGTGTRGLRGSGMNVWRFSPYLYTFGGRYLDDDGNPVFNSPEAVQAVEYYIELILHSPSPTMSWSDVMDAFAAGRIGIVTFADLKMDTLQDPERSIVSELMGYGVPPAGPLGSVSGTSVHGLAISAPGTRTEAEREAAAAFIAWFTSQENELRQVEAGYGLTNARSATFESPEFEAAYPVDFAEALSGMLEVQRRTIAQIPEWGEMGDYLGIKLEELFTAAYNRQPYDIQAALDDAVEHARRVLGR